ncbi:PLP-dependent aminotransferase family protein [Cupriavidus basilensis]|uniref:PLP-dependent aminotransferase family protein n=1 Tax=Cupriavidus basilensis TaxID=68895 RepID=A0ABT6AG77_9BURK|nr:PLP-dependent aminotransferase family protein [Cupriavidus basilensis]MDF3831606.1 PLP-dependent aminotransferase family protein [Cupriavidus basilensis]
MNPTKIDTRLPLNEDALEPLYRQIYARVRNAIADGLLKPGDRIPAARGLAKELGLARGTVDNAYALLVAEGYVLSRGQAGTVVAPGVMLRTAAPRPEKRAKPEPFPLGALPEHIKPLQLGLPALDAFPRKIWARISARCVRAMQPADMAYPPVFGQRALRTSISTYLNVSRGIDCKPSQVILTSGYRETLGLVSRALLDPGSQVWVEDPGYPPTRALLQQAGYSLAPVPVDHEGIVVAEGVRSAPHARAAVVTPAHQSPLCVSLSLPRRLALLDWASRNQAWIVEDDYDGEYRYVGRPLPALKSLDRDGRVLYSGTFSKVLFPGIRLAYLVVPEALVERFEQISQIFGGGSPALTQAIVSAFMAEGHFARHIQRTRKLYGERRDVAAASLSAVLAKMMQVEPQPGGMHLVLRMHGAARSDSALAARMRASGLYAQSLTDWSIGKPQARAVFVSFTNIESEATAVALGSRIRKLL